MTATEDFRYIDLAGGGSRVTIVPALGGKIAALEVAGRQWLWTNDAIPYRRGVDGTSYVETADSGGYDECFPTVGACRVPTAVRGFAGVALPDHGELWAQEPEVRFDRTDAGEAAVCAWRGRRLPYRFARTVVVTGDGEVVMRYAATNEGADPLPFLWSAHPLLPLGPRTRIVLPEGARTRVYAQHGIRIGEAGAEHEWPYVEVDGVSRNLSRPAEVAPAYACKLFVDMPVGRAAVEEDGARLEVLFNAAEVPNMGVWINHHGSTPFAGGTPYTNLGFEPCIGAPDTLDDALGAWQGAHWLPPGDTREWTLVWRGSSRA